MSRWGFTNDEERIIATRAFRDAAIADGWEHQPTYQTEDEDRASTLMRDGFQMQVLTRDNSTRGKHLKRYEANISMWGPDGLSIATPATYDMEAIRASVRTCHSCKATDVDTQRYSFAGRCCAACLPAMRAQYEKPGWCD